MNGASSFGALTEPVRAYVKIAKVVSVHRDGHSVEVQFLDGGPTAKVPVLSGWLGSNFGAVCLTAPTYDTAEPAKKTYPENSSTFAKPATITSDVGRDIYAVILQAEGGFLGTAGMWVIGFQAPQVSEMIFARHDMNDDGSPVDPEKEGEFDDMLLIRHPSDVQVTIDKTGQIAMQHPSGAYVTVGPAIGRRSLNGKDYDQRYQLRENRQVWASIKTQVIGPQEEKPPVQEVDEDIQDGTEIKGKLRQGADGDTHLYAKGNIVISNGQGCVITLDEGGGISIVAPHPITIDAGDGVTIHAGDDVVVTGQNIRLN